MGKRAKEQAERDSLERPKVVPAEASTSDEPDEQEQQQPPEQETAKDREADPESSAKEQESSTASSSGVSRVDLSPVGFIALCSESIQRLDAMSVGQDPHALRRNAEELLLGVIEITGPVGQELVAAFKSAKRRVGF